MIPEQTYLSLRYWLDNACACKTEAERAFMEHSFWCMVRNYHHAIGIPIK